MGTTLNRNAYQRLIDEDLIWLAGQARTLEREHIIDIVRLSPEFAYDAADKLEIITHCQAGSDCGHCNKLLAEALEILRPTRAGRKRIVKEARVLPGQWVRDGTIVADSGTEIDIRCDEEGESWITVKGGTDKLSEQIATEILQSHNALVTK